MAPPRAAPPAVRTRIARRPTARRERRAQDADVRVREAHGLALAVVVEHPGVVLVHQLRDGAAVINTVAEAHGDAAAGRRQRAGAGGSSVGVGAGAARMWFSITLSS